MNFNPKAILLVIFVTAVATCIGLAASFHLGHSALVGFTVGVGLVMFFTFFNKSDY